MTSIGELKSKIADAKASDGFVSYGEGRDIERAVNSLDDKSLRERISGKLDVLHDKLVEFGHYDDQGSANWRNRTLPHVNERLRDSHALDDSVQGMLDLLGDE